MRLSGLVVRGFRNLRDAAFEWPDAGAVLLGPNGQGKSNLLEAVAYPVLWRSMRGAPDQEVAAFGGIGFRLEAAYVGTHREEAAAVTWELDGRRKRIVAEGEELRRLADAVGRWLAVTFLPGDVALAGGGASERRQYLDRLLALAEREYLTALTRYRAALQHRNAALRQNRRDVARACVEVLAQSGSAVVASRLRWVAWVGDRFGALFQQLGERGTPAIAYRGKVELADPCAWAEALERSEARDLATGVTHVGPQRDDLTLTLDGRPVRSFGSTGQLRTAAIALRLLECETIAAWRGERPALVLDDVFSELDGERQTRLAAALLADGATQLFVSSPRREELPANLALPVWTVRAGEVTR